MGDELKDMLEEGDELNLQFHKRGGVLPVIVQEQGTGQILMLGYVNKEAVRMTLDSLKATFWSTSKNKIWVKGETSGNYLKVVNILVDCDQDALVYQVKLEKGGVCHTTNKEGKNRKACFYRAYEFSKNKLQFLEE